MGGQEGGGKVLLLIVVGEGEDEPVVAHVHEAFVGAAERVRLLGD
jgi:hypothetical protein